VVRPWIDPVVEAVGQPPDGRYVELFWLGVLGPTATWLLRRLVMGLVAYPDGYELDLAETAAALGLSLAPGRHSPFTRALDRCVMFGMAHRLEDPVAPALAVRRSIPPLAGRQVDRLPPHLRAAHRDWMRADRGPDADVAATDLARLLAAAGDPPWRIEQRLHALGIDALVAARAVADLALD
jgi:hypothetical protein